MLIRYSWVNFPDSSYGNIMVAFYPMKLMVVCNYFTPYCLLSTVLSIWKGLFQFENVLLSYIDLMKSLQKLVQQVNLG